MKWQIQEDKIEKVFLVLFGISLVMIFVFYLNSVANNKVYRTAVEVQNKLSRIDQKQGISEAQIIKSR